MTVATVSACPLPPTDFAQRQVPVFELNLAASGLYRIHRSANGPLFFNRLSTSNTVFRFDAPADQYGVLYAASTFSACMFETLIRNRYENGALPLLIEHSELYLRSVSSIGLGSARVLRLADFSQSLAPLGGNSIVMSVNDYTAPNAWSLAVFEHPDNFDGIYFQSRYSNEPCVALFDRVEAVVRGMPTPLLAMPELDVFLDKYQIAIL